MIKIKDDGPKAVAGDWNDNTLVEDSRAATTEDIMITLKRIDNLFEQDEYYISLQAQEKITNLKIMVYYKDSKDNVLLTKNQDYTVTYQAGRMSIGTYTVTIKYTLFSRSMLRKLVSAGLSFWKICITMPRYIARWIMQR